MLKILSERPIETLLLHQPHMGAIVCSTQILSTTALKSQSAPSLHCQILGFPVVSMPLFLTFKKVWMLSIWDKEFLTSVLDLMWPILNFNNFNNKSQLKWLQAARMHGRNPVQHSILLILDQLLFIWFFSRCFLSTFPKLWNSITDNQPGKSIYINRCDDIKPELTYYCESSIYIPTKSNNLT